MEFDDYCILYLFLNMKKELYKIKKFFLFFLKPSLNSFIKNVINFVRLFLAAQCNIEHSF